MTVEIIEKSCLTILKELRRGRFSRLELESLQRFFQEIVNITEQKLLGETTTPPQV